MTNEELQAKQEDKEARRAIEGRIAGKRKRKRNAYSGIGGASDSEEDLDDEEREVGGGKTSEGVDADMELDPGPGSSRASPVIVQDEEFDWKHSTGPNIIDVSTVGGALRKNADGTLCAPKVVKRKAKGQRVRIEHLSREHIDIDQKSRRPFVAGEKTKSKGLTQKSNKTTAIHHSTAQTLKMTLRMPRKEKRRTMQTKKKTL